MRENRLTNNRGRERLQCGGLEQKDEMRDKTQPDKPSIQ